MYYILKCIRHINDSSFIRDFNNPNPEADINFLRVTSNGESCKGEILYKICGHYSGFCGAYLYVLFRMWYADSMGMSPIVEWGKELPYFEESGVDGVTNVWEYYFLQYKDHNIEDYNTGYRVACKWKNVESEVFNIKNTYKLSNECVNELARIMCTYIRLRPDIEKYIYNSIQRLFGERGEKILGVQIRMGGMTENFNNHPVVPTLNEYITEIKRIFCKGYKLLFLATDDNRALNRIRQEFGDVVLYYADITRVDGAYSTYCVNTTEELHFYKCGLEVLLDMYTLARCDGLIAGISSVNMAAQVTKIAAGERYEDLLIIDKGINHNNKKNPEYGEEVVVS